MCPDDIIGVEEMGRNTLESRPVLHKTLYVVLGTLRTLDKCKLNHGATSLVPHKVCWMEPSIQTLCDFP